METQLTCLLILYLVTWVNYFINFNNLFADFGGGGAGQTQILPANNENLFLPFQSLYLFYFLLFFCSWSSFSVQVFQYFQLTRSDGRHTCLLVHNYKGNVFIFHHAVLAVDVPFIRLMKFLAISRGLRFCLFMQLSVFLRQEILKNAFFFILFLIHFSCLMQWVGELQIFLVLIYSWIPRKYSDVSEWLCYHNIGCSMLILCLKTAPQFSSLVSSFSGFEIKVILASYKEFKSLFVHFFKIEISHSLSVCYNLHAKLSRPAVWCEIRF